MKCYFQFRHNHSQWIKGQIISLHGGKIIDVSMVEENGNPVGVCQLMNTEILFGSGYMTLTGYIENKDEPTGRKSYILESIDISGGWVKPKGE